MYAMVFLLGFWDSQNIVFLALVILVVKIQWIYKN